MFIMSYQYVRSHDGVHCDESRTHIATLRARRVERMSIEGRADCPVSVTLRFDRIEDFNPAVAAYRDSNDTDVVCVVNEEERSFELTTLRRNGENVINKHCLNTFVESLLNTYPRPPSVFQTPA